MKRQKLQDPGHFMKEGKLMELKSVYTDTGGVSHHLYSTGL